MSLGGGGGGGGASAWAQMAAINEEKQRIDAERADVKAKADAKAAEDEKKRVDRAKGGGLAAFMTAGAAGYPDRTLGGGNSMSLV